MLHMTPKELQDYVLARVAKRTGHVVTWDDLMNADLDDLGGVDTINDLLDASLISEEST